MCLTQRNVFSCVFVLSLTVFCCLSELKKLFKISAATASSILAHSCKLQQGWKVVDSSLDTQENNFSSHKRKHDNEDEDVHRQKRELKKRRDRQWASILFH